MIITTSKQIKEYYKKNNLKIFDSFKVFPVNRQNIISKQKKDLLLKLDNLKDFMKQKNSLLNEFLCKTAKEKEKKFYFDLNELLNSKSKELLMQRIKQNIMLFRKFKLEYDFLYVCDDVNEVISDKDVQAFLRVLEVN
jgi:hypothetical protein